MGFAATFTPGVVRSLSGPRSYERGIEYRDAGLVRPRLGKNGELLAEVQGTRLYTVELSVTDDGGPEWSCTCPAADDGSFCKHCVAVAMSFHPDHSSRQSASAAQIEALSAAQRGAGQTKPTPTGTQRNDPDLAAYLSGLPVERLVALLLAQAERDRSLKSRLAAEAAAAARAGLDVLEWHSRLRNAFSIGRRGFIEEYEVSEWSDDVYEALGDLEELIEHYPGEVVELAASAYRLLLDAIDHIDDSGGYLTDVAETIRGLHLEACGLAKPDPVALARWLATMELTDGMFSCFTGAAAQYADHLGPAGLTEYARAIDDAEQAAGPSSGSRYGIRAARLGIAEASGDLDTIIAVRAQHLGHPGDHLAIARLLDEAGRHDEASDWARRGLADFPDRIGQSLPVREYLAARLRAEGDAAAAVALFWEMFERAPTAASFDRLIAEAGEAGEWWREAAIDELRSVESKITPAAARSSPSHLAVDVGSPVEALLHALLAISQSPASAGASVEAWAVAQRRGCHEGTWVRLAEAITPIQPLDAIEVYQRQALAAAALKHNEGYRVAVERLERIRRICVDTGDTDRFVEYLLPLRREHRAKRNLQALLDQRGWPSLDLHRSR